MKNYSAKKLVITGILAALVFVVTSFTKIPSPFVKGAYYHAGDSIIFLSALVLGAPASAFVAGIGSFLSDLYLGFPIFMFATLIIKGIMGFIAGYFLYVPNDQLPKGRKVIGLLLAALWMVVGYYFYEVFILGYEWRVGLLDAAANLVQAGIGIIVFIPLSYSVARMKKQ